MVGTFNNWGRSMKALPLKEILSKTNTSSDFSKVGRTGPYLSLINCASLPKPKRLKDGAKLKFSEKGLPFNIRIKDSKQCSGYQVVYGFDTDQYAPVAFASNKHNEEQALYARVLARTNEPTSDLDACIAWCKVNHKRLFKRVHSVKSVPFSEYLRRSNATPSVKKTLQSVKNRLNQEGIDEFSSLSPSQLALYTCRSSFVKVENNLYQSLLGIKDKAPRLIQGAPPEFICLVGPWIMALQDIIKRRWGLSNNLCFTSGISAEDAADFITKRQGNILEDDLGKFDCSINSKWCHYEVWLCKEFGAPRAVLDLMRANIKTHGKTHHGWRYKCEGTRKSGDPYTSLMNSIINGLSHLYLYCKWSGRTCFDAEKHIFMLLQGDDNAMVHTESTKFPWKKGMAGLGFDSDAIYRSSFDTVEFCSNRLYQLQDKYIFGPKPGKVLAKFGYIINPPANVSRESMMRGVALGLQKLCNHIPPIKLVIDRTLTLTEGHEAYYQKGFEDHIMKSRCLYDSTTMIDYHLYNQYYYHASIHESIKSSLNNMRLGDKYNNPNVILLLDRDTSGPQFVFGGVGV
jgi:hypothetical protein